MKKNDEIVVTNKFFEKYCTTIVIIYMSVPTTFMSLVLSDLFLDIIVAKIKPIIIIIIHSIYALHISQVTPPL